MARNTARPAEAAVVNSAKVRKDLRTWLRNLHDEIHVTTIFVTHDQEEAMDVAEQLVVMN